MFVMKSLNHTDIRKVENMASPSNLASMSIVNSSEYSVRLSQNGFYTDQFI